MTQHAQRIMAIEALRGFAAAYVFIGHAVMSLFEPTGLMAIPFKFGGEAVMLFFVISGFTVSYSHEMSSDKSFAAYFRKRFIRIYPIFLLSLLISNFASFEQGLGLSTLIGNIFMLQEYSLSRPGVIVDTYRNPALWSLSYEWWFYMIFWPIYTFMKPNFRIYVSVVCSVVFSVLYFYFKFQPFLFIGYFSIWWNGVELATAYMQGKKTPSMQRMAILAVPVIVFGILSLLWVRGGQPIGIAVHPFLEFRQSAVAMIVIGIIWIVGWDRLAILGRSRLFAEKLAPISYGIYALHFPIVILVEKWIGKGWIALLVCLPLVYLLASWAEFRFQPWANRLWPKSRSSA